jgi:hypothetical protein
MGVKLKKGFEIVMKEGGLQAQMRLAMKSGMSSEKAGTLPDSPDNISKMEAALKTVLGKDVKL